MPKVTIIIPVYNVEKFLRQSLDSVVCQSLKDIEIICVDDCSTDNSLEILKEYASKDNRIKIIEKKVNQGQGVARNEALNLATGDYVGYIDPDDWVEPDMFEALYNKASEFDTDIAACNFEIFYADADYTELENPIERISEVAPEIKTGEVFNFNNLHKIFLRKTNSYAWCRIYKRKFLIDNNIKYSDIRIGEDRRFCCLAKLLAQKIIHVDKVLYHYRRHRARQFPLNTKHVIVCLDLMSAIYERNPDEELLQGLTDYLATISFYTERDIDIEERKEFEKQLKQYLPYAAYKEFRKKARKIHRKDIFNINNKIEFGAKYKYLSILGFKFRLGKKK